MTYTVNLKKGEVWHPQSPSSATWKVQRGVAWATYEGFSEDLILKEGALVPSEHKGLVLEPLSEDLTLEASV